jgi:hypothetical protein
MRLQKSITVYRSCLQQFFSSAAIKRFVRRMLTLGSLFSFSTYAWVRLLFHDVPFEWMQEAGMMLDLLVTGCSLVGLCIAGFNLLMFATDYYNGPVKKEKFMIAIRSVFTTAGQKSLPPEYSLFNNDTNFSIDKTGRLRYVVKIIAKEQPEENACTATTQQGAGLIYFAAKKTI